MYPTPPSRPFPDRRRLDRIVLVGTPWTIASLVRHLRADGAEGSVDILGAIVMSREETRAVEAQGLRVLGTTDDIERIRIRERFDHALVSLPGAMRVAISSIRAALHCAGVRESFLPTMQDVLAGHSENGRAPAGMLDLSHIVGRPARRLDDTLVGGLVRHKRVLVTGAGGSIGSELARIIARFEPEQLILMDRSDNALFEIDRQILALHPGLDRRAVLHDVVDTEGTLQRMMDLRPHVVLHAAAHKHVPLMEDHPAAAVSNNLFGTKSVADASMAAGVERFVMISTDKAVNPTSVMGATKRLAEMYVRSLNGAGGGRFALVRFGNVLGSACSVLPIWERQIREGGPVTVTDRKMTRYFMTIPEAAGLVLEAAALDEHEVFVLDMGEPVRIFDLARRFIEAQGLAPVVEGDQTTGGPNSVRVVITGARPGEKLYEELSYRAEELAPTSVDGVMAWGGDVGSRPSRNEVMRMVADMSAVRTSHDAERVITSIRAHVPEMIQPDTKHCASADAA